MVELLDIHKYTAVLFRWFRTRRQGKWADALVKLRRWGLRMPLPSIHLANLRSLPNKIDIFLLLSRLNRDFIKLCCSVFHGNLAEWRHSRQRASSSELSADQIWLRCRINGKSRGGGTWFYNNERWCTDVRVLKKMCCCDLEMLFINCKQFYSPGEFWPFILVCVYIPLQAHVSSALQKLTDMFTDTEQQHPDSILIILGDFNKANISRELPKYSMLHVPPETVIYWITVTHTHTHKQ